VAYNLEGFARLRCYLWSTWIINYVIEIPNVERMLFFLGYLAGGDQVCFQY